MFDRLSLLTAVVVLAVLGGAACGDDGDDASSRGTSSTAVSSTTSTSAGATTTTGVGRAVIVGLKVDWSPESTLTPAEVDAQHARVDAAIDGLVRDLGTHGRVTRRLVETAQLAVSVDAEGDRILSNHPLVASVSNDSAEPAAGAGAGPETPETTPTTAAAGAAAPTTTQPADDPVVEERQEVVVGLRVAWTPESQLSDEAAAAQRARIEAAQDEVVRDLGVHGTLTRRLTETSQMSVSVDAEGRRILAGHPLVGAVGDDTPVPPS